jgi:hypothetical protein
MTTGDIMFDDLALYASPGADTCRARANGRTDAANAAIAGSCCGACIACACRSAGIAAYARPGADTR